MKNLIDIFMHTIKNHPNKPAFSDIDQCYSYQDTDRLSAHIASLFMEKAVYQMPIALFMVRSAKVPIAMVGVLRSGNFYTSLDVESLQERLEKIVCTLKPKMILCDASLLKICTEFFPHDVIVSYEDAINTVVKETRLKQIAIDILPSDPAFAIFTSGSTGFPKGTLITQHNVIAYMDWFVSCFQITSQTNFGSQTPFYFSMSVSDLFATLFTGATYHIIPKGYFVFPAKLIAFLDERMIDTIYWVPTALGIVAKFDLLSFMQPTFLQKVFFAGEVMPVKYLNYWQQHLPHVMYANLFGPTETTDICSYFVVNRFFSEEDMLPIGINCKGARLYVIDEHQQLIKEPGKTGELYVGGDFVAKGYYNNPAKTLEVFVQNPLQNAYPEIVYKTGDLVKWNHLGELLYIGRKDYQIKHMGYRIELGEIEAVMNTVKGIELSVCLYDDKLDEIVLIYEGSAKHQADVINQANQKLPAYMIPAKVVAVDSFPTNANGKIDKKYLQARYIK